MWNILGWYSEWAYEARKNKGSKGMGAVASTPSCVLVTPGTRAGGRRMETCREPTAGKGFLHLPSLQMAWIALWTWFSISLILFQICFFSFIRGTLEPLLQSIFVSLPEWLPQKPVGTWLSPAQNSYCRGHLSLYETMQAGPRSAARIIKLKERPFIMVNLMCHLDWIIECPDIWLHRCGRVGGTHSAWVSPSWDIGLLLSADLDSNWNLHHQVSWFSSL